MPFAEQEVTSLAGRAVHQYDMIKEGDRVLVGLSGGKDSLVLLDFLAERRRRAPIWYDLVAAHLDMGYEDPAEKAALRDYVERRGLRYHFEDTDYAPLAHSELNRENPCFLCSRRRRQRLFELARDYGCNKVALGHNRDDLIETLLINILYAGEISTMLPVQEFFKGVLTVIRPLCMVPEDRIRRVAGEKDLPLVVNPCPSAGRSKRREVKEMIARLARDNDKIKGNMFRALSNWRPDYLLAPAGRRGRRGNGRGRGRGKEPGEMEKEQRKRTRVNFKALVTLAAGREKLVGLATRDLSLKGLFVETDRKLPVETPVDVSLELSGTTSLVSLAMKGKVARVDAAGMGIDFTEIDLDSFYHLRNIVLYNAGDPSGVDDELATKAF
ncbi:MAG: ATP-binding protein [Thermodesulfobacteriota bacterium]